MVKYDSFTRGLTVAQKILGLFHLKRLILVQIQLCFNKNVRQFTARTTTVEPVEPPRYGPADSPENYRPISNLNNISKILEPLFLARIQQHNHLCKF